MAIYIEIYLEFTDDRNELVFQCLLNYNDLLLCRVIKYMYVLVISILEDSTVALLDHNVKLADDVIQRDDDAIVSIFFLSASSKSQLSYRTRLDDRNSESTRIFGVQAYY
jgi:phosphate uptake regulator